MRGSCLEVIHVNFENTFLRQRIEPVTSEPVGLVMLGRGCSTAVEHLPHAPDVVGSHPVGAEVLLLLFTLIH